jgi:hypothetical protein
LTASSIPALEFASVRGWVAIAIGTPDDEVVAAVIAPIMCSDMRVRCTIAMSGFAQATPDFRMPKQTRLTMQKPPSSVSGQTRRRVWLGPIDGETTGTGIGLTICRSINTPWRSLGRRPDPISAFTVRR